MRLDLVRILREGSRAEAVRDARILAAVFGPGLTSEEARELNDELSVDGGGCWALSVPKVIPGGQVVAWNVPECEDSMALEGVPAVQVRAVTTLWGLLAPVILIGAAAGAGCSRITPEEGRAQLVGDYKLTYRAQGVDVRLASAELTLAAGGEQTERCHYKDGTTRQSTGTWEYLHDDRAVILSPFGDCAGLRGAERPAAGGSLLVEWTNPPTLVVDPDVVGVFYQRQDRAR